MRAEGRAVDTVQAANTTRAPPDTAAPARREEEEADGSPEAGGGGAAASGEAAAREAAVTRTAGSTNGPNRRHTRPIAFHSLLIWDMTNGKKNKNKKISKGSHGNKNQNPPAECRL